MAASEVKRRPAPRTTLPTTRRPVPAWSGVVPLLEALTRARCWLLYFRRLARKDDEGSPPGALLFQNSRSRLSTRCCRRSPDRCRYRFLLWPLPAWRPRRETPAWAAREALCGVRACVRALGVEPRATDRRTRPDRYAAGSGPRPAACVTQISSGVSPSSRGWDRRRRLLARVRNWVVGPGALPFCKAGTALTAHDIGVSLSSPERSLKHAGRNTGILEFRSRVSAVDSMSR